MAEEFQESTNSIRVEFNRLSQAGLLVAEPHGNINNYTATKQHPLFVEMQSIVAKYLGFDRLVEVVIINLGNVQKAIVLGDYAKGKDTGTIELMLVGKEINREYLDYLVEKAEAKIHRKVKVQVVATDPDRVEGLVVFDIA
ncbi:MAG TPA: hypothetical protein VK014_03700 [Cyclobacteriaceae bacterium]|nr:hypothetical protein [Cyclobacteriaceae bacterium]